MRWQTRGYFVDAPKERMDGKLEKLPFFVKFYTDRHVGVCA